MIPERRTILAHLRPTADGTFDLHYAIPMPGTDKNPNNADGHPHDSLDDDLDFFSGSGMMDETGNSSPFIKDEPDDFGYQMNSAQNQRGYNLQFGQQFRDGNLTSIDPNQLSMPNGNFFPNTFASSANQTSSLSLGHSGIADDELADLDLNHEHANRNQGSQAHQTFYQDQGVQNHFTNSGQAGYPSINGSSQMNHMYSNTPDGAPIQSPFTHGNFNYGQFAHLQNHMTSASPQIRPTTVGSQSQNTRHKSNMPHAMNRQPSDSRSPMTPKTPGLVGPNVETPESGSLSSQPMHTNNSNQHRRQTSLTNQWDNTPGSLSYVDSPVSSPSHAANHPQISEILTSGKHASLPTKVDGGHPHVPTYQTQEAKRRRRRESHNQVERRRRDNINERIQELSRLVPEHRLQDEQVRKHLMNNSPLSPALTAVGRSPPQATSLLAASGGRRATSGAGSISVGIPIEEKEKGPNKGDILNGAVSWTRDLMWGMHQKLQQEGELMEILASYGREWPFEQTEDEKRMRTELLTAMNINDPSSFSYSRTQGTGLRVPHHTNLAGEPLSGHDLGPMSPTTLSPERHDQHAQPAFWSHQSLKEEDEYGMEMN